MTDARIKPEILELFEMNGSTAEFDGDCLKFGDRGIPIRDGIPRFTPDESYSANFDLMRQRHRVLQLDSVNGTTDRQDTIRRRTGWPDSFYHGKRVLECGCGAGPDTEYLTRVGAKVVSVDLAGVDVARKNLQSNDAVQFVQANIMDLPLRKKAFDIVFCHRVLQHTPDPKATLNHILGFVKEDGAVFVHSYSKSLHQMFRWKYALRPITRNMNPERLYRFIEGYSNRAFKLTNRLNQNSIGRRIAWIFVPFLNYRHLPKFALLSDDRIIEYAVHDTFDALSPRYDRPLSVAKMRKIAAQRLAGRFEVVDDKNITILRTML